MKQVLIKNGEALVEEIPVPQIEPGYILVRVEYSCISIGTEVAGLKMSGLSLWRRALLQPENVRKALTMIKNQGLVHTRNVIGGKLQAGNATGYSAAGTVVEVGSGVNEYRIGDKVACAGAQCAHHAEYILVPKNLTVKVPHDLDIVSASTVTLGAIALQGLRRAHPTLGETFVVIGLGILGQLTVQLLKSNGCKVIGIDPDEQRINQALSLGMDWSIRSDEASPFDHVLRRTHGFGADGVIITAATASDEVVSTAFKMCRKKGRVVLVGDVGLKLNRADFYQKEIDFFISSSYGPGRYDPQYEENGQDYPIGYVRWTENRNMLEYLALLAAGKVTVTPLIGETYPITKAHNAYQRLKNGTDKPLLVLLSYSEETQLLRVIQNPMAKKNQQGSIKIAVVGAGGFAKGMHLPNIQALSDTFQLQAVMSRTGHNAVATARQFNAGYATTDYQQLLTDPDIDAVIIATRHHLHADLALQALKAGKHVLVEKPLALHRDELQRIQEYFNDCGTEAPVLLTGFNRRFSPCARRIKELIAKRSNPMIINYRMNAGHIPLDHWVHGAEGGGRNIGEACHIYDLFTYLTDASVTEVHVQTLALRTAYYSSRDNFVSTVCFSDGSVATLTYIAIGSKEYPKEQMEVFVDGMVLNMHEYQKLSIYGSRAKGINGAAVDKGQKAELVAFGRSIIHGGEWPIPLWQQIQATEIAFLVEEQLGGV